MFLEKLTVDNLRHEQIYVPSAVTVKSLHFTTVYLRVSTDTSSVACVLI